MKLNAFLMIFLSVLINFNKVICQENKRIPEFAFWTVGNSVTPRLGNDWFKTLKQFAQNEESFNCLLQELSTGAKTKEELLTGCSFSKEWLDQAIDQLLKHNSIVRTGNLEYYTKMPVMTHNKMKGIQKDLKPIVKKVAQEMAKSFPQIMKAYNESKSETDPGWDNISHLVIDKLLIDGYFHIALVKLERENEIKRYYSEDQKKIPVFFLESESEYGTFGVNWYGLGTRHVYILHGAPLKRFYIPFINYGRQKDFANVFQRIGTDGSLSKLTDDEIQIFISLGWVENNKLSIPFIESKSLKVLKKDLENIGNAGAKIVFNNFSMIMNSYEESTYSKYSEGAGDYIQVCYHLLFTGIINELIELDVLPEVPDPLPEDYGVYITLGSFWDD